MQVLDPHAGINYPTDQPVSMDEHFYKTVIQNITECLRGIELDRKISEFAFIRIGSKS